MGRVIIGMRVALVARSTLAAELIAWQLSPPFTVT
jgi:hypothetical protein